MKISFDLSTKIEVHDADFSPQKEEVEKHLAEVFESEGMTACGLEVTNYCVPAGEAERRTDE